MSDLSIGRTRRERAWLWRWIAFATVLTIAPNVVAVALAPTGTAFLGSLLNTDDTAQFLAAMRQGAEGKWLYRNPFTSEDSLPVVMYPLYIVWGKLTGWLGRPLLAYHGLRLLGMLLLLAVLERLARALLTGRAHKPLYQTAFLLAAFSSGLSWLAAFLPQDISTRYMADLTLMELTTFQTYYVVPNFAWGLMFQLLTFLCYLRAVEAGTQGRAFSLWALAGGMACLALGLIFPFALVIVYAVLGVTALFAVVTRQEGAKVALWSAVLILAPPAALVAYYARVFLFDPMWSATHMVGNIIGSPPVLASLAGYGLVWALAVAGAAWALRDGRWRDRRLSFALVWAAVNGLLIYAPVPFQGRFGLGLHTALSMLAAPGLAWLVRRLPPARANRRRNIVLILTVPSTMLIVLAGPYMAIAQGTFPFYLPREELQAVDWLAQNVGEQDAVLASYAIGNVVPTRAPCRVFVGHQFGTYRLDAKLRMVDAFFAVETPDLDRQALLRDYELTFVYYGSIERGKGGFDPAGAPYLERVYRENEVDIYRVRSDAP
ncbi:MAG: hypothetical protein ISS56_12705 [Anaerolineae bacterium]|nr:hypothetical protein [Anaerolineae bacterium]